MSKEIETGGCIEVLDEITMDEVSDAFVEFIESKGWYFGGGFHELPDEEWEMYKKRLSSNSSV